MRRPRLGQRQAASVSLVPAEHERDPLLTIDDAAAYLNVPARWVADAVRERKVRCTRIGKHVRFRVEHLDELIEVGEQPVTAGVIQLRRDRRRSSF